MSGVDDNAWISPRARVQPYFVARIIETELRIRCRVRCDERDPRRRYTQLARGVRTHELSIGFTAGFRLRPNGHALRPAEPEELRTGEHQKLEHRLSALYP